MESQTNIKEFNREFDRYLEKKRGQLIVKRIIDIVLSIIGIVVMAIPMIIISIAIKLNSKGPVLFRQERVGKDFKHFKINKFRTMVTDAEKKGMQITVGKDSRITSVGNFLRKSKLDEFPQLFNVLFGEMSFVGPRPEVPKYVELYDDYQKNVLKVKPGITDLASIEYRDESTVLGQSEDPEKAYIEEVLPTKLELNMKYIKKMSVFYDFYLIMKTLLRIVSFERIDER
ncbi:sugar transferase [Gallicola sp. Sow4_E12]|uniref:sugar transferase n=1 Tax=Gallicola sp. Sow4_E12 TaxID=3438785 RepID=UPI003F920AF0